VSFPPSRRASSTELLRLRVTRSTDPVPLPNGSGTEVWHDVHGRLVGYGHAGERWLHVPGVATFSFDPSGMVAVAREDVALDKIRDAHRRLVLPLALQALGQEVLHASAVEFEAGAVVFCGASGTGKSTVAYAFARRGHPPCADDAVAVDLGRGAPELVPLPFALKLRPASAVHYDQEAGPLEVQHPVAARRLAAICMLQRGNGAAGVRRLGRAEAFPSLLAHAYCFGSKDEARTRRMLEHYLSLASQVPVLRVRPASGLDALAGTLDEIQAAVA
jgi:hypothetical protein